MRGTILGLLLPIVLMPQTVRADHGPPTWVFSGTVTTVNDPGGFLDVEVDDPASGRRVWTTTMTQIFDGGTVAFYQEQAFSVIGVRLDVGGVDYEPDPSAHVTLQIHDDNATFNDRFSLGDAALTNNGGLTYSASGLTAVLQDEDQTVFSSTAILVTLLAAGAALHLRRAHSPTRGAGPKSARRTAAVSAGWWWRRRESNPRPLQLFLFISSRLQVRWS